MNITRAIHYAARGLRNIQRDLDALPIYVEIKISIASPNQGPDLSRSSPKKDDILSPSLCSMTLAPFSDKEEG